MATIWLYRDTITGDARFDPAAIVGYDVEALDGRIGTIDEASNEADRSHVVVDTGFWIFGKKRLIPAGVMKQVDHDAKSVWITLTKDEVRDAPDYRHDWSADETSRSEHERYFDRYGW